MTGASVFLHSMWRTGSSYLLSRFEANAAYLCFYEPFNGELSSESLMRRAAHEYEARQKALRHPIREGGYFHLYRQADPESGRLLSDFADPRLPIHDVYTGLSQRGTDMIAACERFAAARGQRAVFGFCHSGVQIPAMKQQFGGHHIYLYRAPREQFASYSPLTNDFFIAATVMQLLASPKLSPVLTALAPSLELWTRMPLAPLLRSAPHRLTMRLGRKLWHRLCPAEMYGLFYLSWMISNNEGQRHCAQRLSLAELAVDARLKERFASQWAISFGHLDVRPNGTDVGAIDFDAIEARVRALTGMALPSGDAPNAPAQRRVVVG